MNVVILIDRREAIPVRAIPYVTGWRGPRGISPDLIAHALGQHSSDRIAFSAMQSLSAFALIMGKIVEVRQSSWRMVKVQLDGLSAQIEAEFPNDRKERRNAQSLAAWHTRAVGYLPKGVFVWLDEFEKGYRRYFDFQSCATRNECPGERDSDLTLGTLTDKQWAEVMEGLEAQDLTLHAAFDVTNRASSIETTDKVGPGKTKETATTRNARRYQMCVDAGLTMPDNTYERLPDGIGQVAEQENITTQGFSKSVKAHIATLPR